MLLSFFEKMLSARLFISLLAEAVRVPPHIPSQPYPHGRESVPAPSTSLKKSILSSSVIVLVPFLQIFIVKSPPIQSPPHGWRTP